jgi:hypothetical protein
MTFFLQSPLVCLVALLVFAFFICQSLPENRIEAVRS